MWSLLLLLLIGYVATVVIEMPILWVGLHPSHSAKDKRFAALWLTACTYPIVVWVFPQLIDWREHRIAYLVVAETFAIVAECSLFVMLFGPRRVKWARDLTAIAVANLTSFGLAESLYAIWT